MLCAAAVLVTCAPPVPGAAAATAKTTDYLNLRQGAGTNTKILMTLARNTTVTVLDSTNGQWIKVRTSDGREGYCSAEYLSVSGGKSTAPSSFPSSASAKTTTSLNVRVSPSLSGGIVAILTKGTELKVLDDSNSQWVKVQTSDGRQGWCFRQYLSMPSSQTGSAVKNPPPPVRPEAVDALSVLKSDTPFNMSLKQGAYYTYKFTGSPSNSYNFVCGTGSVARTASLKLQGGSYYFKIYGAAPGRSGIYACAQGKSLRVGIVAVADGKGQGLTAAMTDYVNLRSGPGLNYGVLLTMSKGSVATVLDNSNSGWVKVRTSGGKQGWCSRQYVKVSGSVPSPASSQTPSASTTSPSAPSGTPTGNATVTGATVTASLLRLRSGAGTSFGVLDELPQGTYLKVLDTSVSGWVKVQTPAGKTGYVSSDYVKLLYNGNTGSQVTGGSGSVSASSATIPQGKTLWLTASSPASWSTSNPSVATVENGYVTAVSPGTAQITAGSGTCAVTVTAAESVRATYASPNIASPGGTVTFTAVTDSSRDGVRFDVAMGGGSVQTLSGTLSKEETTNGVATKVWTASASFPSAGVYSYTVFSSAGGTFGADGVSSDAMVATQGSETVTTSEQRRASDKMIDLIARWEGCRSQVYADGLSSGSVPTIGYGDTLGKNAVFYNNISGTEAWALLVNTVNHSSCTTELNRMIANNRFLMNQNQADALISFAYNVGASYFNRSAETDFRRIMKNAVVPPSIPASGLAATVTYGTSVRADHATSASAVGGVSDGASVTVTETWYDDTKNVWYAVRTADGMVGWINAGYVELAGSDSLVHDLNYTNAAAFGSELILWNQAGGKFIPGLFYRRLGEADVYSFGDYGCPRDNRYGYTYPDSAAGLS